MAIPKDVIIVNNSDPSNIIKALRQHAKKKPNILKPEPKSFGIRSIDRDLLSAEETKRKVVDFIK